MARPECELIIQCARACEPEELALPISTLVSQVTDWEFFLKLARWHQVRPLVHARLKNICPDLVPVAVMAELRHYAFQSSVRNLELLRELIRLVTLFKVHDIPALSLKGPVQASTIYGGLGMREIADLDILVHQQDVLKVKDLMLQNGYLAKWIMDSDQERNRIHGHHHYDYPFISEDGNVVVEVHWNLLPENSTFNLTTDYFWENNVSRKVADSEIETFSLDDTFLFLCIHNEQHNWRGIKFIADAAFLLKSWGDTLNWDNLLQKARELDHYDSVLLTAHLASQMLDAPIPQGVKDELSRRTDLRYLAALMRVRLFFVGFNLPWIPSWLEGLSLLENRSIPTSLLNCMRYFPRYVQAILTPERIDRELFPPMHRSLTFLCCGTRVLRFISNKINVHLPKRKYPEARIKGQV